MDTDVAECCFCGQPILAGQGVNHLPIGSLVIHTQCLQHDSGADDRGSSAEGLARAA
jgi:hypothetical protein